MIAVNTSDSHLLNVVVKPKKADGFWLRRRVPRLNLRTFIVVFLTSLDDKTSSGSYPCTHAMERSS